MSTVLTVTFWLLLGFLLGAPVWTYLTLRETERRREWEARRRAQQMRRSG